jgi:hypothetical protein
MPASSLKKRSLLALAVAGASTLAWLYATREKPPERIAADLLTSINRGDYAKAYELMPREERKANRWTLEGWTSFCKIYIGDPNPASSQATFEEADPGPDKGASKPMWKMDSTRQYYFRIPGLDEIDKKILLFGVRRNAEEKWTPDVMKIALLYGKRWSQVERLQRLEKAMRAAAIPSIVVFAERRQIKLEDLAAANRGETDLNAVNSPYP